MADANRTLNQSVTSDFNAVGVGGTYGFETARSTVNTSADLVLKEERHSKSSSKTAGSGDGVEMANLAPSDVDFSATHSTFNSPRNLLTSMGT